LQSTISSSPLTPIHSPTLPPPHASKLGFLDNIDHSESSNTRSVQPLGSPRQRSSPKGCAARCFISPHHGFPSRISLVLVILRNFDREKILAADLPDLQTDLAALPLPPVLRRPPFLRPFHVRVQVPRDGQVAYLLSTDIESIRLSSGRRPPSIAIAAQRVLPTTNASWLCGSSSMRPVLAWAGADQGACQEWSQQGEEELRDWAAIGTECMRQPHGVPWTCQSRLTAVVPVQPVLDIDTLHN